MGTNDYIRTGKGGGRPSNAEEYGVERDDGSFDYASQLALSREAEQAEDIAFFQTLIEQVDWGYDPGRMEPHRSPGTIRNMLVRYAQTGRQVAACAAGGITPATIRKLRKEMPDFSSLYDMAYEIYCGSLEREVHRRAFEGLTEPVIGGKDRDMVVARISKFSDALAAMHLKRHIPEYREKQQMDLNVGGGVLLVPAPIILGADWTKLFAPDNEEMTAAVEAAGVEMRLSHGSDEDGDE